MLIYLSHTSNSDLTVIHAIMHSKASVIWSHLSARAVHNVTCNVPNEVLTLISTTDEKKDGIIMVHSAHLLHHHAYVLISQLCTHVRHSRQGGQC